MSDFEGEEAAYVIEDDVPLPPTNKGGNHCGPRSPFCRTLAQLKPGQSVLTPNYRDYKAADQFILRMRPNKYAIRKIGGQGWRVWRTE